MAITTKHILLGATTLALTACTADTDAPSGIDGKQRVEVSASFAGIKPQTATRAYDASFVGGDKLVAHLRQAKDENGTISGVGGFDRTVTFTVADNPTLTLVNTDKPDTYATSDLTPDKDLYWDDFSDATNDIRTENHGLQCDWGYCYNGNSAAPATPADVLAWTVSSDQTDANTYLQNDLLWVGSQSIVAYEHGTSKDYARKGLTIPYTHATSKATITLHAEDGFDNSALANTTVTLNGVNRSAYFTASTNTITYEANAVKDDIKMCRTSLSDDGKTAVYECFFVPSVLTEGQTCATITNADGNQYTVSLTTSMMTAWELTAGTATKSAVNYALNATLRKQGISVTATIADWVTKDAATEASINFATDLTNISPATDLDNGSSYDIFKGSSLSSLAWATQRNFSDGKWSNSPEIYWQNANDDSYFRALAKLTDSGIAAVGNTNAASQDEDLLWGTTAKHTGTDANGSTVTVEQGAAVSPRTTSVPMVFSHALSRVTINLKTTTSDDAVDLTDAVVTIPGIINKGTIDIATGAITPTEAETATFSALSAEKHVVIPQSLTGKVMTITLKDGTTYKLTLTDCADISAWESGTDYTYTISLAKEAINAVAFIKDWTTKTGSGDASLDWD